MTSGLASAALLVLACACRGASTGPTPPPPPAKADPCEAVHDRYEMLLRTGQTWGFAGVGPGITPADLEVFRVRHRECF